MAADLKGIEAHAQSVRNALEPGLKSVKQGLRQEVRPALEVLVAAARHWEAFKQASPREAELIEAGVSVADALRNKEP